MKLFIAGGNRKFEDEPLKYIVSMSKRLGIQIEILTDKIHLNKECKSFKNLKNFLIKNQIKHRVFNNLNLEFSKIKKSLIGRNNYLLATNCIWIFKTRVDRNRFVDETVGMLKKERETFFENFYS